MIPVQFFKEIFSGIEHEIELRAISPGKNGTPIRQFVRSPDEITTFAEQHTNTRNVYFGCATRNGGGRTENIEEIPFLWMDVDFKDTPEEVFRPRISGFPLPPTYMIHSGRGFHVYWKLREPASRQDNIVPILRGLATTFGGDLSSTDLPRILRVPGTLNHKYSPPRDVRIIEEHPEREYSLSDFTEFINRSSVPVISASADSKMSMTQEGGLPLEKIHVGFDRCQALKTMLNNAEVKKRLTDPSSDLIIDEHTARIGLGNYCLPFRGGEQWAIDNIYKILEDFNESKTRNQLISLVGKPPRCSTLCPKGQCDEIKRIEGHSPIKFVQEALRKEIRQTPSCAKEERIRPQTAAELLSNNISEPQQFIETLLGPGEVLFVGGPPKVGKSYFTLSFCLSLASGTPFLGFNVPRPLRVLLLSGEGSIRRLKQRLQIAKNYYKYLTQEDLSRLSVDPTEGQLKIDTKEGEENLSRLTKDIDIVAIDPYYRFLSRGDENSHTDQRVIQDILDRLKSSGKGIILVHHTRKQGNNNAGVSELRGAGSDCYADAVLMLSSKKAGNNFKSSVSFTLRHHEEPPDMDLKKEGPFFFPMEPTKKKVNGRDVQKYILKMGGRVEGRDAIVNALKESTKAGETSIKDAIKEAEKNGWIHSEPKPGRGQGRVYIALSK